MPNREVTIYEVASGRLVGHASLSEGAAFELAGTATIDGTHDLGAFYVADGEVRARPELGATAERTAIVADGSDAATLGPFPEGSELSIDGGAWQPVAGMVDISVQHAGSYRVEARCWPHLCAVWTIEATEP